MGGATRARLTYDQLSMSQWVQGFCRNILDEQEEGRREQMISYTVDLMEDATDFSWQGAKAAHAVLCCELERGTVSWMIQLELIESEGRTPRSKRVKCPEAGEKVKWPVAPGSVSTFKMVLVYTTKIMRSVAGSIGTYVLFVYSKVKY